VITSLTSLWNNSYPLGPSWFLLTFFRNFDFYFQCFIRIFEVILIPHLGLTSPTFQLTTWLKKQLKKITMIIWRIRTQHKTIFCRLTIHPLGCNGGCCFIVALIPWIQCFHKSVIISTNCNNHAPFFLGHVYWRTPKSRGEPIWGFTKV